MRRALSRLLLSGVVLGGVACGPSPAPSANPEAPSGTLVVVIRQGPARVPFHPKVARIQRANEQLSAILGHSIEIELDGSLLPQTHEGAEDVIARLVEDVARDLDALRKEDARALAFARAHFARLVVRYAPSEAAAREDRWRRRTGAKLDVASKTVDVVRAEASWRALERDEVASVLYRAFVAGDEARFAGVLPDRLSEGERRGWFDYHAHGGRSKKDDADPFATVGSVVALRVRGMVMLSGLATRANDAELARDVRAWLVNAASDFGSTYHHHAAEVERAPSASSYRQAESAYVRWVRDELGAMTLDERAKIAAHLFVIDFRKDHGERDRFATYAFPGLDPMAFSLDTVDAWIAAGRPPKEGAGDVHPLFDTIVCPASVEDKGGSPRFSSAGRCDGTFYRWALASRPREDSLVKAAIARGDTAFGTAVFYNARRTLRDEADYLRFLRRFESTPALWKIGADAHREVVYRPSEALLEESRRLWREVPAARGHALFWFARHADGSYHPASDWPDLVQGTLADDAALGGFLALGAEAFELLPAAWPGVAKGGGRMRLVTARSKALLAEGHSRPGRPSVSTTLANLARAVCKERSMGELAELRTFAATELAANPGAGLSDVVEATDPTKCSSQPRVAPPAVKRPTKTAPKPREPKKPDLVDPFASKKEVQERK
ncbi:MAG: hypothetical protein KF795_08045 [Labilithrix sp.]|nr:hypothetical protein [Labilithrix sp.]